MSSSPLQMTIPMAIWDGSVQAMRRAKGTQSGQETAPGGPARAPGARSVLGEAHPTGQGFGDSLQAGRNSDTREGQ